MNSAADRFTLRPARLDDLPPIMDLERSGFDPDIREAETVFARRLELFPEGFLILIDRATDSAAGYYCAERWPAVPEPRAAAYELGGDPVLRSDPLGAVLYTASMTISPDCRGTGAGSFLFRSARERVLTAFPSLSTELLIVRSSWTAARRVYAAEGFQETAWIPCFFADQPSGMGVVMEKGR